MNRETKAAVVGALVASLVTVLVGFPLGLWGDRISRVENAKVAMVSEFADRDFGLSELGARYVSAIVNNDDLEGLRQEIRGVISDEIIEVETLKSTFARSEGAITSYQDALSAFAAELDAAMDPTTMRSWVEAFGQVIDARVELENNLNEEVGV